MFGRIRKWMPYLFLLGAIFACWQFQDEVVRLLFPGQAVKIQSQDNRSVEMRTVLSRDAIPAIDNPTFLNAEQAERQYRDNELVIGVNINGDARAYSVPFLSGHEIVNDTVGGKPIAVTW